MPEEHLDQYILRDHPTPPFSIAEIRKAYRENDIRGDFADAGANVHSLPVWMYRAMASHPRPLPEEDEVSQSHLVVD